MSSLVQTEMGLQLRRSGAPVCREHSEPSKADPIRSRVSLTRQDIEVGRTLSQAKALGKSFFAGMRLDD